MTDEDRLHPAVTTEHSSSTDYLHEKRSPDRLGTGVPDTGNRVPELWEYKSHTIGSTVQIAMKPAVTRHCEGL